MFKDHGDDSWLLQEKKSCGASNFQRWGNWEADQFRFLGSTISNDLSKENNVVLIINKAQK